MDLFKGQNLLEFAERFKTDEDCKEYLSHIKWSKGYVCLKCGHKASQTRANFSRVCNKCSHIESVTANTLFHKVKFGVRKSFFICFEMSTTTKSLSASYMAERFGVTEKTARLFMHKVREAMKSSGNYPMDGNVHIDEFVIGGKEEGKVGRSYDSNKKKVVCAVELTEEGKVHQVKSWIRTTYSWVSATHVNRYLDEFCYRLNRSQMKENIFNNIIQRMVAADNIFQSELMGR